MSDEQAPRRNRKRWLSGFDPRTLKGPYGNVPLLLLTIVALLEGFGPRAFTLLLPDIQRAFKVNLRFLITLTVWVSIIGLLISVPGGYLGDRTRRTRLSGLGGVITAVGNLLTVVLPGRAGLIVSRSISESGQPLAPVGFSLVSDYYPQEMRGKAYSFRYAGFAFGAVLAPVASGLLAVRFGWRMPFLVVGIVGLVSAVAVLFLPEPIRGYHERKATGADEETSKRQQEPPSFGEAFRAARSVRTLRRISYSYPFFTAFELGYAVLLPLFLNRVFKLNAAGRGYLIGALAAVSIPGLLLGGTLVDKLVGSRPGRVVLVNAGIGVIQALTVAALIFAPSVGVVLAILLPYYFVASLVRPAFVSVASLVIPPRLRSLGLASLAYWELLGGLLVFPLVEPLASHYGVRAGLLGLAPLALLGSIVWATAAPFVDFDIRSANAAAMASEAWRIARETGRAKLLVIRDLDVRYEGVQVLFGVDLDVEEGELIALLGTNGAGKSTLLRAISGLQEATGGAIVFSGRDITHVPPHEIARQGVAQTPGGRGVFHALSVRENLALAQWQQRERREGDDDHTPDDPQADLEAVFASFPILRDRIDEPAGALSGGEQQMLTLAQAFLARPKLLMIDELSLGLAPTVVDRLLGIVRAINERGTTVIVVEQSVNVAMSIAKRAVFMEKGEVRFDGPAPDLLARPDILRAVFLGSSARSDAAFAGVPVLREDGAPPVLQVQGAFKSYGGVTAVADVDLEVADGASLGLIGPNGAGKTTLFEIVSGFTRPDAGRVLFDGRDVTDLPPQQRAKLRMIRRFQDARLFPSLTVDEALALAMEQLVQTRSIVLEAVGAPQARVSEQRIRRRVATLVEMLELGDHRTKFVGELSTGMRRIVDIGVVLASEPRLLLLDEPSSGLAQRETEGLGPLLRRVVRETGCTLVIIEHDMPLIASVCDELVAMHLGSVLTRGRPAEVLADERVIEAYLGTSEDVIARSGVRP